MSQPFPLLNRSGVSVKRDQVWQRPFVEKHCRLIAEELDRLDALEGAL